MKSKKQIKSALVLGMMLGGIAQNCAFAEAVFNKKNADVYLGLLYLQPHTGNLNYAVFVSGTQPYYQSWHYQALKPDYSPGFEVGGHYRLPDEHYQASLGWIHLNTRDASFKQAARTTDLSTIEFVSPPFEQSPPVFGIKRADSSVTFDFDSIALNAARLFEPHPKLRARLFGGINVLKIKQKLTTVFSDMVGVPGTDYSYALAPDPAFSFQLQNTSDYLGVGPDLGFNVAYTVTHGIGILGEFLGTLTAGNMSIHDRFTSTSTRLTTLGIGTSHQEITVPDTTQVVPGFDGKLGLFYNYTGVNIPKFNVELGYRFASYINGISTVNPSTLVQPGTFVATPEFSTGTMAIVSSDIKNQAFNFNGPYIKLNVALA